MEEIKRVLKGFSPDEQKLVLFRSFIDLSPERSFYVLKNTIGEVEDAAKLYMISLFVRKMLFESKELKEIESIFDYDYDYERIIDNFIKLSDEMHMSSSLELSNLYTYMLWNGYFSRDKGMKYGNVRQLPGIKGLAHEIMNGKGTCLNVSTMLTDILNKAGYDSAVLISYGNGLLKGYHPKIDIAKADIPDGFKLQLNILSKLCGNHAVSLVGDENGMYIYDPQNISIFGLIDKETAETYNGRFRLNIKPFASFYLNDKEDNCVALTRFLTSNNYCLPCDRREYKDTWERQLEKIDVNNYLLRAFHSDIRINIDRVNEKMERVKRLVYK